MICLKSTTVIAVGILGVAAFMVTALFCPLAFVKWTSLSVKPGVDSELDNRVRIARQSLETLTPKSPEMCATV